MMLSDADIKEAIKERESDSKQGIFISPFEEKCLTPIGYDLRVGRKGFSWKNKLELQVETEGKITIEPQDTVIIETLEEVSISKKIGGTIHSMVSRVVPQGLSHISTTIDPGWTGKLIISIHNYLETSVELEFGQRFCTACFYEMKIAADKDVERPADRYDLWERLREKAREERDKARRVKEEEEKKKRQENQNRILWLGVVGIFALSVAAITTFTDPALGTAIATIIAGVSPFLVQVLKPR